VLTEPSETEIVILV
jgi:hypothetical protein